MPEWRRPNARSLRAPLGIFVVLFAAYVVYAYHRGTQKPPDAAGPPPIKPLDTAAQQQTTGGGHLERYKEGKVSFSIRFGGQLSYADGRTKLFDGVEVTLPKGEKTITIKGREAELTAPPDKDIGTAHLTGDVTLTTSDGVTVTGQTVDYDDKDGVARIPGPLAFTRGRMTGSGIGGTYDRNRDVLWILDRAKVDVAADERGEGAVHVTAKSAGFARPDHYMKFTGDARLEGEKRIITAGEVTVYLTEDEQRIQRMELRTDSRIASQPGASGADMQARDIDLAYAPDGRTLQTAHLVENAVVQLPGDPGKSGRRVAGQMVDIALAPDGSTVTSLNANEKVQVDLPADGATPARRIRSATLAAAGPPVANGEAPGGLQRATFSGGVDFRETRAANAKNKIAAVNRTARSERLDVTTKPGFGDVQTAEFHGAVHFTDGTDTTADAPVATYDVAGDRLNLQPPAAGEHGAGPHVSNSRLQVDAGTIQLTLTSQSMKADTNVRSVIQPQRNAKQGSDVKMPGMLEQGEPVNVEANRLEYDGNASVATYSGRARLWQQDTVIQADRIVLDDRNGNLRAAGSVRTVMALKQASAENAKPAAPSRPPEPTTTVAEEFRYEDSKHLATYTTKAHMSGPDGDLTTDKLELYLTPDGGQLERAEAYGNVVSRQETRRAYGNRMTYIAAKDEYTMVGTPVKIYDDTPPNCKVTTGATLTFHRAVDTIRSIGNETASQKTESIACGTVKN
jgi:lipopolysaccharide export system protein LptA